MMSRGSVELLLQPLNCTSPSKENNPDFVKHACSRIDESLVNEKLFFRDGMSVSDIMDAHGKMFPFREYDQWRSRGGNYCMLGDW